MSKNPVTSRLKAVLLGAVGAITLISLTGPRSGGVYTLPSGNPVSTGTAISSTVHNNTMSDIATALTQSLSKDGQTTVTGNIPFGGFKATNVADATARNQWASAGQVQDGSLIVAGSVSGTDTITAALNPAITSYATGMQIVFEPAATNTGAATIALNGLAAKGVVKLDGDALAAGDLVADVPAFAVYDGTSFVLLNPQLMFDFQPAIATLRGGATEPILRLYREANGVGVGTGYLQFNGNNASSTMEAYGRIQTEIVSNTAGSGTGAIDIEPVTSGNYSPAARFVGGQTQLTDGSSSSPGVAFINDTNTGMYRSTTDRLVLAAGGTGLLVVGDWVSGSANDVASLGRFFTTDGSIAAPSISFTGDTNTGIYLAAGDDLGVSVGGTRRLRIAGDQIEARDGSASNPAFSFMDDGNNGMYRIGTDNIGLSAGGTKVVDANATTVNVTSTNLQHNGVSLNASTHSQTGTWTGCTGGGTVTVKTVVMGNIASVKITNSVTCTGSATSFGLSGAIPAAAQPASGSASCYVPAMDNGNIVEAVMHISTGSSNITFIPNTGGAAWTASGVRAIRTSGMTCTYPLT